MYTEKWNELCYTLSESISKDLGEDLFELKVIQALSVLGWSEFKGDLNIRSSVQVGASKRLIPDIIVKSDDENLFVIEVKRPSIPLSSDFRSQIKSYMRQLKLDFGILIGQKIQIFYDGTLFGNTKFTLIGEIEFIRDNKKGKIFIDKFSKQNFSIERLNRYAQESMRRINNSQIKRLLIKELTSKQFENDAKKLVKAKYSDGYDPVLIDQVFENIEIIIKQKNVIEVTSSGNIKRVRTSPTIRNKTSSTENKLSKSQSIAIINKYLSINNLPKIYSRDIVFSNKNSANDKWWFEPKPSIFEHSFALVLNDYQSKKLFVFNIPAKRFYPPTDYFYYREKENRLSITIEGYDTRNFIDKLKNHNPVSFKEFLSHKIPY